VVIEHLYQVVREVEMETLESISRRLALWAAYLSGLIMVYMVIHVLVEIVLRVFFSKSTYVLDEFVAYATAAITFLSLSYALREDSLIRVNMLLIKVSGKLRWVLEFFSVSTMLVIVSSLTYYFWIKTFWRDLTKSRVSESIAEVPLWIPEVFVLIGLILLFLQLFTMFLRLVTQSNSAIDSK